MRSPDRTPGVARQIVDALEQLRRDGHETKEFEDRFNKLVPQFPVQRSQPDYLEQLVDLLNDVLALYAASETELDCAYPDNKDTNMMAARDKTVPLYTTAKWNRAKARSTNYTEIGFAWFLRAYHATWIGRQ